MIPWKVDNEPEWIVIGRVVAPVHCHLFVHLFHHVLVEASLVPIVPPPELTVNISFVLNTYGTEYSSEEEEEARLCPFPFLFDIILDQDLLLLLEWYC